MDFNPKLDEQTVREEGCKVAEQMKEQRRQEEEARLKKEAEEAEAKQLEEEKVNK